MVCLGERLRLLLAVHLGLCMVHVAQPLGIVYRALFSMHAQAFLSCLVRLVRPLPRHFPCC